MNPALLRVLLVLVLAPWGGGAFAAGAEPPPLLLISLDGFRWDYCEQYPAETVRLRELRDHGVSARGLISVYPSNTFPNHYSIVTGLYPAHHGLINNTMFDPVLGEPFSYRNPEANRDPRWWGGEPIWITAGRQGGRSACFFWPGSETEIKGLRPAVWKPFDYRVPFETRLDELIATLGQPPGQRPLVTVFYLEETNSVGHAFGENSPELAGAVRLLDGRVGAIADRLREAGVATNIIVVSDHGMTPASPGRVILLDDYLDLAAVQVDFDGTAVGLRPRDGDNAALLRALSKMPPAAQACLSADLPARFHLKDNPRIPPVWIMVDEGWRIETRAQFERHHDRYLKGDHGYDPALKSMHGILIACGPSLRGDGTVIAPVENIHLYNLMCALLKLTPAANDGDDRLVRAFMKN